MQRTKNTWNFLVDFWLAEQMQSYATKPTPNFLKAPESQKHIKMYAQKNLQQEPKEVEYKQMGFNSQAELDLMKDVKRQGGTKEDGNEILQQYRQSQQGSISPQDEKIPWLDIWVKTWEAISNFWDAFKIEAKDTDNILMSGLKFLWNLPWDTVQLAGDLISIASNPVWTVKSVEDFAWSMLETGFNKIIGTDVYTSEERRLIKDSVAWELKKISEDPSILRDMAVNNPADLLFSITWGFSAAKNLAKSKWMTELASKLEKAEAFTNPIKIQTEAFKLANSKVLQPVLSWVKEVPIQLLWKTTGAGAEAIRTAFSNGGKESFAKAMRGEITDEDILNNAKKAFDTIKEQRRDIYWEDYTKLVENKTKLWTSDIEDLLVRNLEESKVKIVPTEKWFDLDFSASTITQNSSQSQIKQMFDDVIYWSDDTPEGLDILKQRVQDRWIWGEGTTKADRLSTVMSNAVKDKVVQAVPEYAEMTAKYEKLTNEIKEINRVLSLWDEKSKMTAITRLGQSMKDNLSFRKEMVEKLEELSGMDLKSAIAGAGLRKVMPKWIVWALAPTGLAYWVGAQLLTPAIIPIILTSSPRVIGELARAVWVTRNVLVKWLENAQQLFKNTDVRGVINAQAIKGKEALGNSLDDVADKVWARAKFMDDRGTGMDGRIDDFNTASPAGSAIPKEVIDEVRSSRFIIKKEFNPKWVYRGVWGSWEWVWTARYGQWLYTTSNKKLAKQFAWKDWELLEMDRFADIPANPAWFETNMDFWNFLDYDVARKMWLKGKRAVEDLYPDLSDLFNDLWFDGIVIGKWVDNEIVKFFK